MPSTKICTYLYGSFAINFRFVSRYSCDEEYPCKTLGEDCWMGDFSCVPTLYRCCSLFQWTVPRLSGNRLDAMLPLINDCSF